MVSVLLSAFALSPARGALPETEIVSVTSDEQQVELDSHAPSISGGGRYVAFESPARLAAGDTNHVSDIYVRDMRTGRTSRISLRGNNGSFNAAISSSGSHVAYDSAASRLVPGDNNRQVDVFIFNRTKKTTRRVSLSGHGAQGNDGSYEPAVSATGRFVAFWSYASTLVAGDGNGRADVFVRNRMAGSTRRVSVRTGGGAGNGGSYSPAISKTGRYVGFESFASNFAFRDYNQTYDVFVHDRKAGTTRRASINSRERPGNGGSFGPSISGDGSKVAFWSGATNLVRGDTNGSADVFVRSRSRGRTRRVSVSSEGAQANGPSFAPAISTNGRFVAFWSYASNLAPGDTNDRADVFLRDLRANTTTLISVGADGTSANNDSFDPTVSSDGLFVAFSSDATDVVLQDANRKRDVFRRRWRP